MSCGVSLQRQKLASSGVSLTKVTLDSFLAWKERKVCVIVVWGSAADLLVIAAKGEEGEGHC